MRIQDKVAIVIGGARGMGQVSCKSLLDKGAKVCIGDIHTDETLLVDFQKQYGDDRVLFVRCDVTSDADVEGLFDRTEHHFGSRPDIVLTTAGIIDEKDWQKCIDVNVGGCIRLVNTSLHRMGRNLGGNGGVVVLMSSVSGLRPENWAPVYSASKHAVIGLTRSWAEEKNFQCHGIRFNCLCPGAVDTAFLSQITNAFYADEHQVRLDTCPRLKPSFIADGFIQLVEDESLNGQAMLFDHGKQVSGLHEFNDSNI